MSISRLEFKEQSFEFVEKCQELGDEWHITIVKEGGISQDIVGGSDLLDSGDQNFMLTRSLLVLSETEKELLHYEYTVIYNDGYEAPVMYFNISDQSGSPIVLEDTRLAINKLELKTVVNQVEHPLLFRPFYMIHPCRTQDFMRLHDRRIYLICWLSTVGTLLNLKLKPYFGRIASAK